MPTSVDLDTVNPQLSAVDLQPSGFVPGMPMMYDSGAIDTDFWDPNILSTTNWLDAIDTEFSGLPVDFDFTNTPATAYPPSFHPTSETANASSSRQRNAPVVQASSRDDARSPGGVVSTLSGPSAVSTESAVEVCAAEEDSPSKTGEYYVDGRAARLPRTKRRKLSSKQSPATIQSSGLSVLSLRSPLSVDADLKHRVGISDEAYEICLRTWQYTCLDNPFPWPAFERTVFPPKELFEHLLGLYFRYFQKTLPFTHPVSFNSSETHWLLLLAMTALGACHVEGNHAQAFAGSLQELLRRCLFYLREDPSWAAMSDLTFAQTQTLHAVGLAYSGDESHRRHGRQMQQGLASSHATLLSAHSKCSTPQSDQNESDEDHWRSFIEHECIGRTAYSIWLLDCMWAYQFQQRPLLGLRDAMVPLPCHEKLWNAANSREWKTLTANQTAQPTLCKALQEIYIDKRLLKDTGEFARIMLIHGLFHRSWEVEQYFSNPMSQWEPTAKKQSSSEILPQSQVSLLSVPTFTRWQNSVCDCLDILHWQANATIGQASGLEHPTVAFLHLARVVLLSPIKDIINLATAMTRGNADDSPDLNFEKLKIQRWAVQGQYKARLAAIHAGVVFWHLRRYSVDGFYEASAVGLACLMLWAFGTFSVKHGATQQSTSNRQSQMATDQHESLGESSDDSTCDIILLDRPADDEIVQQFVRRGHTMRAHITGVGDLYGPLGPERVLSEGCKLLKLLKCWGISASWLDLMQRLLDVCKREQSKS